VLGNVLCNSHPLAALTLVTRPAQINPLIDVIQSNKRIILARVIPHRIDERDFVRVVVLPRGRFLVRLYKGFAVLL